LALWKLNEATLASDASASTPEDDAFADEGASAGPWPFRHIQSFHTGVLKKGDNDFPMSSVHLAGSGLFLRAALHPAKPMFAIVGLNAEVLLYSTNADEAGILSMRLDPSQPLKNEVSQPATTSGKKSKKDFGVSLEFDTTGGMVAVGTQRGFVHLMDVEDGTVRATIPGHSMAIRALHFTKDQNLLVGCDDGKVTIYDVKVSSYAFDSQSASLDLFGDDFTEANSSQYTGMTDSSQGKSSTFSRSNSLKDQFKASSYVRSFDSLSMWLSSVKASPDGRILATW
jgi:hypothetical protein